MNDPCKPVLESSITNDGLHYLRKKTLFFVVS